MTEVGMCLAVPGRIISIEGDDPLLRSGKVDFAGAVKRINFAYVPEARVGDYVLVHVGFAISIVDEEEARLVFEYLKEMGELEELDREDAS
ncbi:MAG TPA: HypC/HybG/HupF family hydrogenase formation chaperone [Vicinamibacterales bacterium]